LVTTNVIGRLADRHGKRFVFRIMATAALVMGLIVTNLEPVPLWVAIIVATGFMVTMSGRMVPSQALIAGSARPAVRGGFLSLNSAVQYMGMGLASALSGALIHQTDDGRLPGYPLIGAIAAIIALLSLYLAGRLRNAENQAVPQPEAIDNGRPS
jgi:MFS family permease